MRRERLYLEDALAAADAIARFIEGHDQDSFIASEITCSAVVQKLAVIGEASARVSPELRSRHPAIPWAAIIAFRNILIHAYFGTDWPVVWRTASAEVPVLRAQIVEVMRTEFA